MHFPENLCIFALVNNNYWNYARNNYRCTVTINKGVVQGQFPRKALKKVFEWMDEHNDELMANWARLQNGEEALPIDPLE